MFISTSMLLIPILIAIVLFVLIVVISNIKIVPQASVYVVERLGSYYATWETGLHVKVPFIDRIAKKMSMKEQVVDFAPQPVITKDNVTMQIDTVVFYQVTDAKLYTYGVERPMSAIENLTATTLRNIIGEMELDSTLTSRDVINSKITATLDVATDKWGIKVNRVELKNILPPREIQDAMEKQMKAERERRESILRAEGEKHSQILVAEGEKESAILRAEAEKESAIRDLNPLTAKDILDAAKAGDALADEIVDDMTKILGEALANVARVVNPEVFVIGGGVSKAGSIITDRVKKYYDEKSFSSCLDAHFELATLGNDAGMYGCVQMVLES